MCVCVPRTPAVAEEMREKRRNIMDCCAFTAFLFCVFVCIWRMRGGRNNGGGGGGERDIGGTWDET